MMNEKEKDLLAAHAHGLLEGDDLRRVERLLEDDPSARREFAALGKALGVVREWAPAVPRRRLESMPIPLLDSRGSGRRGFRLAGLAKAAALVAIGFGIGLLVRSDSPPGSDGSPDGVGRPGAEIVNNPGLTPTPAPVRSGTSSQGSVTLASTAPSDLLASGAVAYLAYSVGAQAEKVAVSDTPALLLGLLTDPEFLWDSIPAPPVMDSDEISG